MVAIKASDNTHIKNSHNHVHSEQIRRALNDAFLAYFTGASQRFPHLLLRLPPPPSLSKATPTSLLALPPLQQSRQTDDRADRLAGKATLTSGLLLGRSEVLRSLRQYLRAQSHGHHTIDRLEETGVERGSARRSSLKGRERVIVNQTNIGTV